MERIVDGACRVDCGVAVGEWFVTEVRADEGWSVCVTDASVAVEVETPDCGPCISVDGSAGGPTIGIDGED